MPDEGFFGLKYDENIAEGEKVLFRVGAEGEPKGQWFAWSAAESEIQSRIDFAIHSAWQDPKTGAITGRSPLQVVYVYRLSSGAKFYDGGVRSQGAGLLGGPTIKQVFIPRQMQEGVLVLEKAIPLKPAGGGK